MRMAGFRLGESGRLKAAGNLNLYKLRFAEDGGEELIDYATSGRLAGTEFLADAA